ncbi:hypothetical protein MVEN_02023100 [Mycena venus]|uniref:Uncharacterized protein n=1 Tax=Mycena venus TaxID=2733690 RepID=A0A8H7CJ93_9AGAR|nr:hypothetical protein MVEN_02023100 [Mycena venus]
MSSDSEEGSGFDFVRHYAQSIQRDGFLVHGDEFYVHGYGDRMRRADATRKVAKRQPLPHRDESEDFYLAQVAHYGLQSAKTKEAAKHALLTAFGARKTLDVPSRILQLEKDMREEYAAANKIAKANSWEKGGPRPAKKGKTQPAKSQEGGELCGKFEIIAPFLTEQWEDSTRDTMWLKLSPSSTNVRLWGQFDFGIISGIIRSTTLPVQVNDSMKFFWRGREDGTGESTFGPENVGTIEFLGAGKFKATMNWDAGGNFEFAGTKLEGAQGTLSSRSLREWKTTWRSINPRAYERENRARWGQWGGDGDDAEQPAGSDTTEVVESDEEGYYSGNCAF